ncbi:MAG TPA: hypothetical protein VGL56_04575 [Fimbriimonadaceae bacterium]|jgi:hypothetical protein
MSTLKAILFSALALAILSGCNSAGGVDSNGTQPPKNDMGGDLGAAAIRTNGDYDKLTATEKAQLLQITHGNEKSARHLLQQMVAPAPKGPGGPPPPTGG